MKAELFNELVASVREGGAILRGEEPPSRAFVMDEPNVKQIRAGYRLSQREFAALLGISVATLRNWEQGRRKPEGPARVLLQIAASYPDAILHVARSPRDRDTTKSRAQRRSTRRVLSREPPGAKK